MVGVEYSTKFKSLRFLKVKEHVVFPGLMGDGAGVGDGGTGGVHSSLSVPLS